MKMDTIKEFAGVLGGVEAAFTFIILLGCAVDMQFLMSSTDAFMAMLIIVNGGLLFFTNYEG